MQHDSGARGRRGARALWLILVALGSWAFAGAPAQAEDELLLRWQAPRGCPDATWARARVEERLARPLADVAVGLAAEVTLRSEGRAHTAHVLTAIADGDVGERTLRGASCAEVAEAAALVLSLTVASSAEARSETPAAPALPGHQLADDELAPFLTPRPVRGRTPRPRPFALGAALIVDQGVRDLPAPGPSAYLAYERSRLRLELAGVYLPAGGVDPAPGSTARVDVSLVAARFGACGRVFGTRRFALLGCGHGELGGEYGRARRIGPGGGDASSFWAGAELSLRATWALTELLEGGLSAGALAALHRPRFLVLGSDGDAIVLQRSWPVSARVALQLGARF